MPEEKNRFAKHIYNIGVWIIVLGIIGSFISGKIFEVETFHGTYYTYTTTEYNWIVAICGSIGSVLCGVFYMALSEIINLLSKKRTETIEKTLEEVLKAQKENASKMTKLSYDVKTIRKSIETSNNEPQQDKEDGDAAEELQNE